MKKYVEIFFLSFIGCILAGCQMLPSAIFQNETCSPPCWNGIIPGQTSLQEINAKLESISAVDAKSINTMFMLKPNDSVDFHFFPGVRETGGRIYSQDDVIQSITFWLIPNTLLLSESLQKWGQPDKYISIYYSKTEIPYLSTYIIYTKKGIILFNGREMWPEDIPKFDDKYPIQVIYYVNPELITTLLINGSLDALSNDDIEEGLRTWTGLGEIKYLKRDLWGMRQPIR